MNSFVLRFVFAAIVIGLAVFVWLTSGALPDPVASKFNFDGRVTAYMPHGPYRAFMTACTLVIPFVLLAVQVWLPRVQPRLVSIPNRDYWLAAEQRPHTLAWLEGHTLIFGSVVAMFFAGMHWLIVQAHTRTPPHLDNPPFLLMTGAFVVCTIVAAVSLSLHFRRRPDRPAAA